jgi:hypothetical protein
MAKDKNEDPPTVEGDYTPPLNTIFNPGFRTVNAGLANSSSIPGFAKLDPGLMCSLESMGAKNCIPDGGGFFYYPTQRVRGQSTSYGFTESQFGATAPVWSSGSEVLFANVSVGALNGNGSALLGGKPLPRNLWDIEAGGAYIRQFDETWSAGLILGGGSVSDRPFANLRNDTVSASVFGRMRQDEKTAWLFYVVSTTTGQFGHNIPVPGVAYEFRQDRCRGLVGFPFVDLKYELHDNWYLSAYYCALTDMQFRLNYQPIPRLVIYEGFSWFYESWLPQDREKHMMLFRYEKDLEVAANWLFGPHLSLAARGGYAFDRYFVESNGFSLHGPKETRLAPTPFVGLQLLLQY